MQQPLLKDEQHGPHADHMTHLASCYMGPRSHEARAQLAEAMDIRDRVGTEFSHHPKYGNQAVQGGARNEIAKILGTDPGNITLTVNTNDGLHVIKQGLGLTNGAAVVLYGSEYLDVKTPFASRAETFSDCAPVYVHGSRDSNGRPLGFDLSEFERAIAGNDAKLVVVSHVQFPNGFATDLGALSGICRHYGVPLVVDVAQSFGVLPILADDLKLSAVVAPLWKWAGGMRGTGFLFTAPEFRSALRIGRLSASGMTIADWLSDVGTAPIHAHGGRFETSSLPTEAWIPTTAALTQAAALGSDRIAAEVARLHEVVRSELSGSPRISLYEAAADSTPTSFVAFSLADPYCGREQEVIDRVRHTGVQKPVDITSRAGFVRVAPHHFTSDDALRAACRAIARAVHEL